MDFEKYASNLKKYHRLSNYLSSAMLYLKDNFLLKDDLKKEHIKDRILGHWGTVPGLNFIYGGLNVFISQVLENDLNNKNKMMLITGPGHGAPAIISGLYIEETLKRYYPEADYSEEGIGYVLKNFSWPGGFQSHTWPGLPGQINEGGELGYSLATAFGAVFDNPNLISACIIGDGEAETATIAASWQSAKFVNHKTDGVVLPILHLNGYRISGPTLFSTFTDEELATYFYGLGYTAFIVDQYNLGSDIYKSFLETLFVVYEHIKNYKKEGGKLPVIILRTKKGWTGPKTLHGNKIEDNNLSHGIPIPKPKKDNEEFEALKDWLNSYKIQNLVNKDNFITKDILEIIPSNDFKLGMNKQVSGNPGRINLTLPNIYSHEIKFANRGLAPESRMEQLAEYIRDVFDLNEDDKNFRFFSPDESESNMMEAILDETDKMMNRNLREWDKKYSKAGRVMEILSENVLQSWMEGYIKTGRHGFLASYEAFLNVANSQIDQYIKYLKQSFEYPWRKPVSSLNYISTSTLWRQEHNGYTHQNPSLINSLLTKYFDNASMYFPADVNILLATMQDSLERVDCVNLITACKRDLPQWLTMREALEHVKKGISEWEWAGNKSSNNDNDGDNVDVVLASAGDYQTVETIAAAQILKKDVPELKFKYININEITRLGFGDENDTLLTTKEFEEYFSKSKGIIFNFHGYPEAIKMITWGREISNRLQILGYIEKGGTTTPFDMQVVNKASRYHVCIEAILAAAKFNSKVDKNKETLVQKYSALLEKHKTYIKENGVDIPEITEFKFKF